MIGPKKETSLIKRQMNIEINNYILSDSLSFVLEISMNFSNYPEGILIHDKEMKIKPILYTLPAKWRK